MKRKKITKRKARRKSGLITIESPVNPGARMMIAAELADDALIEGELMGQTLTQFIYQFPQDGTTVAGLSVKGVNEVVRRLNRNPKSGVKIHIHPEHLRVERDVMQDGQKGVEVWVFAENLVDGNSAWGSKFEAYNKVKRHGGTYFDKFALEKALSKAERNAKRKLIPEVLAVKMIQTLMKLPNVSQNLTAPQTEQRRMLPAAPVTSSPAEMEALFERWVGQTKDGAKLIEGLEKLKASMLYSQAFKLRMGAVISAKVDALDNHA